MIKLNIHTKAGKVITIHFHGTKHQEATEIVIQFSDWLATGDVTDAPLVDRSIGGVGRVVIPFRNVEYMEIDS